MILGMGEIHIHIGGDSLAQLSQEVSDISLVSFLADDHDLQLGISGNLTGSDIAGDIIAILNMGKLHSPRLGNHSVIKDGLIISHSLAEGGEIHHIVQDGVDECIQLSIIHKYHHFVDHRIHAVTGAVKTDKIGDSDVINGVTTQGKVVAGIAIKEEITGHIQSQSGDIGELTVPDHAGIERDDHIAVGILDDVIILVDNHAICILNEAGFNIIGYIIIIFTVHQGYVAGNAIGNGTVNSFLNIAIDDNGLANTLQATIHGVTVQVEDGGGLAGQIRSDIPEEDNHRGAGNLIQLSGQVGGQTNLIGDSAGVDIQIEGIIVVAQVLQTDSQRDIQSGILLGNDVCQGAKVEGSEERFDSNVSGCSSAGLIIGEDSVGVIILDGIEDGLRTLLGGQIHIRTKHCKGILKGLQSDITPEERNQHIVNEANGNRTVHIVDVAEVDLLSNKKSSKECLISLLGQVQVDVDGTILADEGHQLADLAAEGIPDPNKLCRSRIQGHVEGNAVSVSRLQAKLHGGSEELTTQFVDRGIGDNRAGKGHMVDIAIGIHHRKDGLGTKAAISKGIQDALEIDGTVIQEGFSTQTNVRIRALDDSLGQTHHCIGQSIGRGAVDLEDDGIFTTVLDQSEDAGRGIHCIIEGVDVTDQALLLNIDLLHCYHKGAVCNLLQLCSTQIIDTVLSDNLYAIDVIIIANHCIGAGRKVDNSVFDIDRLIRNSGNRNGKVFIIPGEGKGCLGKLTGNLTDQCIQHRRIIIGLIELRINTAQDGSDLILQTGDQIRGNHVRIKDRIRGQGLLALTLNLNGHAEAGLALCVLVDGGIRKEELCRQGSQLINNALTQQRSQLGKVTAGSVNQRIGRGQIVLNLDHNALQIGDLGKVSILTANILRGNTGLGTDGRIIRNGDQEFFQSLKLIIRREIDTLILRQTDYFFAQHLAQALGQERDLSPDILVILIVIEERIGSSVISLDDLIDLQVLGGCMHTVCLNTIDRIGEAILQGSIHSGIRIQGNVFNKGTQDRQHRVGEHFQVAFLRRDPVQGRQLRISLGAEQIGNIGNFEDIRIVEVGQSQPVGNHNSAKVILFNLRNLSSVIIMIELNNGGIINCVAVRLPGKPLIAGGIGLYSQGCAIQSDERIIVVIRVPDVHNGVALQDTGVENICGSFIAGKIVIRNDFVKIGGGIGLSFFTGDGHIIHNGIIRTLRIIIVINRIIVHLALYRMDRKGDL